MNQKIIDVSEKRGEYIVVLDKKGQAVKIVGAFHATGKEIVELNLRIIHKVPHTQAETVLHGVVSDEAQLKLFGTIVIEKDAQQTQSFLKERVLLLSPTARAEAVPNLEIEANDVKCSHAATISNIPEEHIFYLMSRGIPREKAQKIIVDGFLDLKKS